MLGGLDWTQTFLGLTFKSQEQILFIFTAVLFIVSVVLHLVSIEEQQYSPQQDRLDEEVETTMAVRMNGGVTTSTLPRLELIREDEPYDSYEDARSERDLDMAFLDADMVRSKSDSVLAMADATLELDRDPVFLRQIEPSIFQDHPSSYHSSPLRRSSSAGSHDALHASFSPLSAFLQEAECEGAEALLGSQRSVDKAPNGKPAGLGGGGPNGHAQTGMKQSNTSVSMRRRRHTFYRQPSSTFSYYGRLGSHRYRYRRANAVVLIKSSRSMNDIYELQERQRRKQRRRQRHQSGNTNSSGDTESDEGETETTVRLLWLSMLKMPPELLRLCVCHLLTWLAIITEAIFYTDFMGQVVFNGSPKASHLAFEFFCCFSAASNFFIYQLYLYSHTLLYLYMTMSQ